MNILVSRTDRAGDLVLTLPVFQLLRRQFPRAPLRGEPGQAPCPVGVPEGSLPRPRLLAHVRSYTAPLLRGRPDVDGVILDDQDGNALPLLRLAKILRRKRIDAAILVHPAARVLAACRLAGIPVRIGRASNLWQGFLTHPLHQHRSRNEKHESAYNLDLLSPLGITPAWEPPCLAPLPDALARGREILDRAGLAGRRPVFVHPGHGGSAANLPLGRYRALVGRLMDLGMPVAVTLGPGEQGLAWEMPPPEPGKLAFVSDLPDLGQLVGVLAHGAAFFGGSTGPMHIAAALGLPTVAFFPLLPAMTPVRWGPCGSRVRVVQPSDRDCPGRCAGCLRGNCLAAVDLEEALGWVMQVIAEKREGGFPCSNP